MNHDRDPADRLPLKELEVHVLLSLTGKPLHGYALLTRVVEQSSGVIKPGPASLYRTVAALFAEGLLEEAIVEPGSSDARRRYFRATVFGRAVLQAELRRWSQLLAHARALGVQFPGSES